MTTNLLLAALWLAGVGFDCWLTARRARKYGGLAVVERSWMVRQAARFFGPVQALLLVVFLPNVAAATMFVAYHCNSLLLLMAGFRAGIALLQVESFAIEREIDRQIGDK